MKTRSIFNYQLLQYMLIGGVSTGLDVTIFTCLIYYYLFTYVLALSCAFITGVFVNFILCDIFVFNRTNHSFIASCLRHYGANLTGFVLNQLGMIILISFLNISCVVIARIIVATCTFIINFTLIKYFVFEGR